MKILVLFCMVILISILSNYGNFIIITEAAPPNSLITQLPGFSATFPSKHYSGYITLDGRQNNKTSPPKNLFYYFVESERNPDKDAVVLWLNGGPGCSSFDGFVYEHGPFNFQAGKTKNSLPLLHPNPYSWSKVASIIYLDSPTGVGLSYSENQTKYQTGDVQTARDTHTFLLKWFEQFPEFNKNPFYVAGESYGGIYVPTLASEIVEGLKAKVNPTINFKGYVVGNGVTAEQKYDGNALLPFAHGMALISDDLYREFTNSCGLDIESDGVPECQGYRDKLYKAIQGLNIYDILEPCYHNPGNEQTQNLSLPNSFKQLGVTDKPHPVRKRMFGRAWPYQMLVKDGLVPSWPELNSLQTDRRVSVPCTSDEVAAAWLNNESVRKAIHAKSVNEIGSWSLCMSLVFNHDAGSMIKYHRNLTTQGYRALIYSGDHDLCVPYTGTQAWTSSLGYQILDEWRPWTSNNQVAGYVQAYEHNLTFITIKGAGHTVPEYKPREALDFFSRWLEGKSI
ncbi:serine carboxypeptidase-like 20 [Chenopodium quinoa]|uniref:serine carboxypeptidase-like 20 n=1 Tax=Chenopodium quinoa TaxID=63459 RepID=UPI000B78633A|nr:serine carboxypeptidase-like 20 [Chenopodium quinoa]